MLVVFWKERERVEKIPMQRLDIFQKRFYNRKKEITIWN